MDRSLNRLLRLYPIARNWTVLSNYMMPFQSVQNISRMYCASLTDHIQLDEFTSTRNNYTINDIGRSNRAMKILEEAASNYTNMTVRDVVDTMTTLFKVSKNMEDLQSIKKHIGFAHLCEVINKDIRLMNIHDIIEVLKVFTHFKVKTNSILMQSLLQMIRTSLNEISLQDLIFLFFLLKKMDSTPLRDALLIALPLIFEIQLPTKLDSNDVHQLAWSLRFASENNINNPNIQEIILKSLVKYENSLDTRTAWSVFCSLCTASYLSPIVFETLPEIQKILITGVKELSIHEMIMMFIKLLHVITNSKHGSMFYNEVLVDACVNSALNSSIDFTDGIRLLKSLINLNHTHMPLLEYLAAKCFEEPNLLKNASYYDIFIFLEGFINSDYKPVFWDTIRDAILANKVENMPFRKSMIKFALHLTALDCFSPDLVKKVFSENIQTNKTMMNIYAKELLLLYQSIKMFYPTYDGPWPSQNMLERAIKIGPILPTYSIKTALELALGGPQYLHNDLRTKLGHYINHVVVMRKGGYPVAINADTSIKPSTIYIEDIPTPNESQIILIFNLPETAYTVNSQRLKSTWLLRIKSVEKLTNCNTIVINSNSWMNLSEHERVPYLMQAIRLKCEDFSVSVN